MKTTFDVDGEANVAPLDSRRMTYMLETLEHVVLASTKLERDVQLLRDQVFCATGIFTVED